MNEVDKIYICHYSKLVKRKQYLENLLEKVGICSDSYEWVELFDKENIKIEELGLSNITSPLKLGGIHENRTIRMSELSLLLKHKYIWDKMIDENMENVLVLEDDVILEEKFIDKFNKQTENISSSYDLVWVGSCCDLHIDEINILDSKYLYEKNGSRCTHGYLISNKCAKIMSEQFKYNNYPVDFYFNHIIYKFQLNNYWMEPDLIKQNQIFDSTIQNDNNFI